MTTYAIEHPEKGLIRYRDGKRSLWLASMFYPLVSVSGIPLYLLSGSEWALLVPVLSGYFGVTLLDWLFGADQSNPPEDLGFMYSRDLADPDGHLWATFWMDPAAMQAGGQG